MTSGVARSASEAAHMEPLDSRWHRRALSAGLAWLLVWTLLPVWVALQEPSLGWRFVPDPQGQGVLAYSPQAAVKIASREQAQARLLAVRTVPAAGEVAQTVTLDSLWAVEAPSMLKRQADLERFFVLQHEVWALLDGARRVGQPVEVQLADGSWALREVRDRDWSELGWLFWVPLACGMLPFVVGMAVSVWRWQSLGARFLGLASVMALLSLAEVSVVTGRLGLLAPWFAESGQVFVRCTSLVAVWAFVMMMLHYPTPMRHARAWMRGSAALLALLLVLNVLQWPGQLEMRYKLWLVVGSVALIALAVAQSLMHRHDPVHRAAARWLAASALVSFSVVMVAFAISLVYDVQVISNSYRWLSVPLLYVGLMVSVGRANLFELERWWVPLCLWYLGGALVVLVDLALVTVLKVDPGAAISLSLLGIGWLYFPLRQWLLARLQVSTRPQISAYVPDLIAAVNAGLQGERAASTAWAALLKRVFVPLELQRLGPGHSHQPPGAADRLASASADGVHIADMGRQLRVPDVGGHGQWQLTLAQGGRQLFTPEHVQVAAQLWQLLDHGLQQQRLTQAAVDQERQRIASDLHDDLGAKLLTLAQQGGVGPTGRLAREALSDMRQSVRGMAGQPVAAADVLADWRAEGVSRLQAAGLEVQWEASEPSGSVVWSPRLHLQLTRLLREALSNVIRHSGAKRCQVRIEALADHVVLTVDDDGRGWPTAAPAAPAATAGTAGTAGTATAAGGGAGAGLGMPGMERRARKLGGEHRFEASAMGGARVWVRVPVDAAKP
jgi:signal transduction histidine kinase